VLLADLSSFRELKPAMTFFVPIAVAPFSFGLKPSLRENVFGSASFPSIHSSAVRAGSSEAVSGKMSSWNNSD
jgi:hypothetical protein